MSNVYWEAAKRDRDGGAAMTQSQRTTINDVAKLAGTSAATVSYFLNGKLDKMSEATRARIEQVIRETGYVPSAHAQGLASKPSGVIAVLIEDNTNVWAGQLVRGVERVAHEAGYFTVVCDTHFDPEMERNYVEKMLSLGVDGFVIQPTNLHRRINERLVRAGKPVVFYDFNGMDLQTTWIKTDLYGGVYNATRACIEKGYEEFVLLSTGPEGSRTRIERQSGFSDALGEHGLEYQFIQIGHNNPTVAELRHRFEFKLSPARRTLLFCPHQWALARVLKALEPMRHLVPERIGLLGLDNADWTDLTEPQVSTIIEPVEEEGHLACEMLLSLMHDPATPPKQRMLPCTTRWLASTI